MSKMFLGESYTFWCSGWVLPSTLRWIWAEQLSPFVDSVSQDLNSKGKQTSLVMNNIMFAKSFASLQLSGEVRITWRNHFQNIWDLPLKRLVEETICLLLSGAVAPDSHLNCRIYITFQLHGINYFRCLVSLDEISWQESCSKNDKARELQAQLVC